MMVRSKTRLKAPMGAVALRRSSFSPSSPDVGSAFSARYEKTRTRTSSVCQGTT